MTYSLNPIYVKPKHLVTTNTTMQSSSNSALTRITIEGSDLEYTPHTRADKVIYEISFSAHRVNDWTFHTFILEYSTDGGSNWVEVGGRTATGHGNSGQTGQAYRWFHHFRYVIPSWSGSRRYRLRVGSYQLSRSCDFHGLDAWDGSSTSTTFTNTTLIMYSALL